MLETDLFEWISFRTTVVLPMTTSAVATKVTPTAVLITTLVEVPLFVAVFTLADATVVLPIIISEVVTNVVPAAVSTITFDV